MHFDPAIAALQALRRAEEEGELGEFKQEIADAEEAFSLDTGLQAKLAYETLQQLGEKIPQARAFQEFLIYITWQQVTEETIPRHFHKGVELCAKFLKRFGGELDGSEIQKQIVAISHSFQGGLGQHEETIDEHDEDAFPGGD